MKITIRENGVERDATAEERAEVEAYFSGLNPAPTWIVLTPAKSDGLCGLADSRWPWRCHAEECAKLES